VDGSAINNISVQEYELTPVAVSAFDKATLEKLHAAGITDVSGVSASNPVTVKSKSLVAPSLQPSQPSSVASIFGRIQSANVCGFVGGNILSNACAYNPVFVSATILCAQRFSVDVIISQSFRINSLYVFTWIFFRCHSSSRYVSPLHHLSDKFTNYH
jgi:hypothetical protein